MDNHRKPAGGTKATVFGPLHAANATEYPLDADIANDAPVSRFVRATIKGLDGKPVANAKVDVWQADADALYERRDDSAHRGRGVQHADAQGRLFGVPRSRTANQAEIREIASGGAGLGQQQRTPCRWRDVRQLLCYGRFGRYAS